MGTDHRLQRIVSDKVRQMLDLRQLLLSQFERLLSQTFEFKSKRLFEDILQHTANMKGSPFGFRQTFEGTLNFRNRTDADLVQIREFLPKTLEGRFGLIDRDVFQTDRKQHRFQNGAVMLGHDDLVLFLDGWQQLFQDRRTIR